MPAKVSWGWKALTGNFRPGSIAGDNRFGLRDGLRSEGNGQQKSGRHGEFDLRFGLRLVCALVCARHIGRSANQLGATVPPGGTVGR